RNKTCLLSAKRDSGGGGSTLESKAKGFLTFTFSHLADAFIQSDLHMCDLQCIHILHLHRWHARTLRQGIELATFGLLNDLSTYCTTVAPSYIVTSSHITD